MSDIAEFLKLYNQLEFGGCIVLISDHTDVKWNVDHDTVYWKEDGSFYSGWMPEGIQYEGDYAICNVDTQCGQWTTCFFLMENRDENLSEDEEEEDFDDK